MIYIVIPKKNDALKRALGDNIEKNLLKLLPSISPKDKLNAGDLVYLDISGMESSVLKKTIGVLKKNTVHWGIIDTKGDAGDPAAFFFDGACDYIGAKVIKKGLNKKRFEAALSWANSRSTAKIANTKSETKAKNILPNIKFEGWKSIRAGTTKPFFILFVSLTGKSNLRSMLGEAAFNIVKSRLRDVLLRELASADALHWMETEDNSLFLIPPRAENGRAVIESILKMILNSRVISLEDLGLSITVDFTFALHYGETIYQSPGKTGAVISETVNYIFHLGTKKAETGRLAITGDVPQEIIPEGLAGLFIDAGAFEGVPIRHSKRFIY